MRHQIAIIAAFFICVPLFAQKSDPSIKYMDYKLSAEERAADLVSRMTLDEKINQLKNDAPAISQLDIPKYNWWNECLHGVARAGYATVFPQSITVAASFDKDLMHAIGNITSTEARGKYNKFIRQGQRGIYQGLTFWSPNINIFRDPRWGRGHETYGEDPYLTGELATQFIKGLQGDDPNYLKVVATSKHFAVHSGPEPLRHTINVNVSDVDLYETYLPAFEKTVKDGGVYSIMGAYNRFRDESCSASDFLLDSILRKKWGFKGYVVSDCGAIQDIYLRHKITPTPEEAAALAVKNGCDLNCGSTYNHLKEAVEKGEIKESEIDIALKRLFIARFKLGMFDPDEAVPYSDIPYSAVCSEYNAMVARQAAQKSIVLLKNDNKTLPLAKDKLKRIAVVGPNANNWEALIGNYNGIPKYFVTALDGIKNKVEPAIEVNYAQGSPLAKGIHNLEMIPSCYFVTEDGKQGLKGAYFANKDFSGDPLFTKVDDKLDFYWEQDTPDPRMEDDNYSVRWTGYLVPPETGTYNIGTWSMPRYTLYLDGKKLIDDNNQHHAFHHEKPVDLEAGKRYKVVFEYVNYNGDGDIKLLWSPPTTNMQDNAVDLVNQSDVAVVVLGLSQRLEGEEMGIDIEGFKGGDRTNLKLPKEQLDLLEAVEATGKPVIVVMMAGSAIAINEAQEKADAIIYAGYGGQEGGNAIADVLFGDYNPAGRLPVTYYKSIDQLPPFEDYDMEGRTYRFFKDEPLYPFGYGLSYTTFSYGNLSIPSSTKAGETFDVNVEVTNNGDMAGEEVVQLYVTDEKGSTPRPIRQLKGFKRISLNAGETKKVSFTLTPKDLSMINDQSKRVEESGTFTIAVGGKQPGFSGYLDAPTTGVVTSKVKVRGKDFDVE